MMRRDLLVVRRPCDNYHIKVLHLLFALILLFQTISISKANNKRVPFLPHIIHSRPSEVRRTLQGHNKIVSTRGGSSSNDIPTTEEITQTASAAATQTTEAAYNTNGTIYNINVTTTDENNNNNATTTATPPLLYNFPATKPGDGSESNPDSLPTRFLLMQKNNRAAAKKAFIDHLAWRDEYDVDTILNRPHSKFDVCKAVLPHYFPGRDTKGNPIFVQRPGMIDLTVAERNNVTMEELLTHYVYVIEYCWNILEPPHDGVMTSVLDLTGVGWNVLKDAEIIGFVKRFVRMMSENYPQRSYKTLIINAPKWFGSLFHLFKPLLRESTRKKIEIHSRGKRQTARLVKCLGEGSLPLELVGGDVKATDDDKDDKEEVTTTDDASPITLVSVTKDHQAEPGPNSYLEQELRSFCMQRLTAFDLDMQEIA